MLQSAYKCMRDSCTAMLVKFKVLPDFNMSHQITFRVAALLLRTSLHMQAPLLVHFALTIEACMQTTYFCRVSARLYMPAWHASIG